MTSSTASRPAGVTGSAPAARRTGRSTAVAAGLGLVLPVALLVLWQSLTSSGAVSRSILPPPADVVDAFRRLVSPEAPAPLWEHLGASLRRVFSGFAAGALLALVLGVLTGLSRTVDRLVSPLLLALRAVPSLAWVPLFVYWLGYSETSKVTLVAIGAFFPVLATLVAGIRQVDPGLVEVARTYGLSRLQVVRTVLLPTAAPSLLAGARLGLAQAWLFLVAAELLGASRGFGFLLVQSQNNGQVEVILLTIALLAVLGKTTDGLLAVVEKRVLARLR